MNNFNHDPYDFRILPRGYHVLTQTLFYNVHIDVYSLLFSSGNAGGDNNVYYLSLSPESDYDSIVLGISYGSNDPYLKPKIVANPTAWQYEFYNDMWYAIYLLSGKGSQISLKKILDPNIPEIHIE